MAAGRLKLKIRHKFSSEHEEASAQIMPPLITRLRNGHADESSNLVSTAAVIMTLAHKLAF